MKNDMKLIMESWRSSIQEQAGSPPATVGEFKTALYASSDPELYNKIKNDTKAYIELYEKVNKAKPTREKLKTGLQIVGVIGALAAFVVPPAGAALVATAGVASAAAGWFADLFEKSQDEALKNKPNMRDIMQVLGIDIQLLKTIEDDIEDAFFMDKLKPDLERWFTTADHDEPLPNFTSMFQRFLNKSSKSPLHSSTTSKITTTAT
jgi:hypothetical protein